MNQALLAIWAAAAAGLVLGLWPSGRPGVLGPVRLFAAVAALGVVFVWLVPHALHEAGAIGLLWVAAGLLAVPIAEVITAWLRALSQRLRHSTSSAGRAAIELSYAGLLVHSFGDGVALALQGHGGALRWALTAHQVPVVTLVVVAFLRFGTWDALAHGLGLPVASTLGLVLTGALPEAWLAGAHGFFDALVAGILLHLVLQEARRARALRSVEASQSWRSSAVAVLLGAVVVAFPIIGDLGNGSEDSVLGRWQQVVNSLLGP